MGNESTPMEWRDKNVLKLRDYKKPTLVDDVDDEKFRKTIEPWLTALFQSEHLSLLVGSGLSNAIHYLATNSAITGMSQFDFTFFKEQLEYSTQLSAEKAGRGIPNIEDQIRVANELIRGLNIYTSKNFKGSKKLKFEEAQLTIQLKNGIKEFVKNILSCEKKIIDSKSTNPAETLMSFLMSFASRSATRERLNIFTTNYDRIIEFGSELSGIHLLDRFIGNISPIFRSSKLELDMHYNPPGIRGEPRYLEGVAYLTKLHGSIDWMYKDNYVRRYALPYGATDLSKYCEEDDIIMIYPNSSKDRETSEYPYVELFRDFAASLCRPNSTLIIYGYSFGDEHINRVISDMLTIPSTHLVIISYDDEYGRINKFYNKLMRPDQVTLLLGHHFGNIKSLTEYYLPKAAIDKASIRMNEILNARGWNSEQNENKKINEDDPHKKTNEDDLNEF